MQAAATLGVIDSFNMTPRQMVADFYKRDPQGDIDRIYDQLLKDAPAVKQAEAKLLQAEQQSGRGAAESALLQRRRRDRRRRHAPQRESRQQRRRRPKPDGRPLAHRDLDRRQLQGNATRASLRIGQPVSTRRRHVRQPRRVSRAAFPASRWAPARRSPCLPPQNATGNFVKVVQRLPVRIDLIDYDPEDVAAVHRPVGDAARAHPREADRPERGRCFCRQPWPRTTPAR